VAGDNSMLNTEEKGFYKNLNFLLAVFFSKNIFYKFEFYESRAKDET
jgi:hypothetical protein